MASLVMSAALFGRRGRDSSIDGPASKPPRSPHDELLDGTTGAPGPLDGSSLSGEPLTVEPRPAKAEVAPFAPVEEDVVDASQELAEEVVAPPAAGPVVDAEAFIDDELLANLEARSQLGDPAPHPVRPSEMWHPDVAPVPVDPPPPAAEELVDSADLEDGEAQSGRFRFSRLKRVSGAEDAEVADDDAGPGQASSLGQEVSPDRPDADVERPDAPVGDTLFGELFTSDRIPAVNEGLGSGSAPLVPPVGGATGSLITGPVRRHRRGSGRALPRPLGTDVTEEAAPDSELDPPVDETAAGSADADPEPSSDDHHADPVVVPTVEVDSEPETPLLDVDADGTVSVSDGSLRLDPDARSTVTRSNDGVAVSLDSGWFWAALEDDAQAVTVALASASVSVFGGATVLVTIDEECSCFVVVVRGEATMTHVDRRIRLRAGAMVLVPVDGDPQVDVATDAEIQSDPLVERNLKLDAAR